MFCYLHILNDRSGISLGEFETCPENDTCKFYKNKSCSIGFHRHEMMGKDKFGWMLYNWIKFETPLESKSKNTRYISIISLVHPSEDDVWIIYSLRSNKKTGDWDPLYRFHHKGEMKEFESIKALNSYMTRIGFGGRKLTESDFLLREKSESEKKD